MTWRAIFPDQDDRALARLEHVIEFTALSWPQPVGSLDEPPAASVETFTLIYHLHFVDDRRKLAYYTRVK